MPLPRLIFMSQSIRTLAKQLGLSTATVSQALRGLGRMSEETRQRVLNEARAMGYLPTPLLSKAFSIMRQPVERRFRETVGFIAEFSPLNAPDYQAQIFDAVLERTRSLGYSVETFVVSGKPSEQRRVSRILEARGIRGLVILPRVHTPLVRLSFRWESFAAVEIGHTILKPHDFHRVERSVY